MAEELKAWFDKRFFDGFANALVAEAGSFDRKAFVREARKGLDDLELMDRLRRAADLCGKHLPGGFGEQLAVIRAVMPQYAGEFRALIGPEFVARFGRDDAKQSLPALAELTCHGSAEFAIRHFLKDDFAGIMAQMKRWSRDRNHHVRRLASEGCRPRLPWSFRLERLVDDPAPAFPILEALKADPELYVRKSVANHLNDIAKDHPDRMLDLIETWDRQNDHTAWIMRHGCRSLIKSGNERALALLGFSGKPEVDVTDLVMKPSAVPWGGTVEIAFGVTSTSAKAQRLAVDYVVHFMKANGQTAPKVFKLKALDLDAGQSISLGAKRSFEERTTRRHYPGRHGIEIQINGVSCGQTGFKLLAPD
jgi:3-methyladenine DNA glycosylase AlkC